MSDTENLDNAADGGLRTTALFGSWCEKCPTPPMQNWYWWRPHGNGVEKPLEVYRTGKTGEPTWVAVHPYGEMEMSVMQKRWPNQQWSERPIPRPNDKDLARRAQDSE